MKRWIVVSMLIAAGTVHAAEDAAPLLHADAARPFGVSVAFAPNARLGLDGQIAWAPLTPRTHEEPQALELRTPFRLDLRAAALQREEGGRLMPGAAARVVLPLEHHEAWFGAAAHERDPFFGDVRFQMGGGVTRRAGEIEFGGAVYARRGVVEGSLYQTMLPLDVDSLIPGPMLRHPDRAHVVTTSMLSLAWRRGPGALSAAGGVTLGRLSSPLRWAHVAGELQVTRHVAMALTLGRRAPAEVAFDPRVETGTSLAVSYSPIKSGIAPAAPEPRPATRDWRAASVGEGRYALHVRCAGARTVHLRGDFTDWEPVAMLDIGSTWWEWAGTLAPGLARLQIRIDGGAWRAPEGLLHSVDGDRRIGTLLID